MAYEAARLKIDWAETKIDLFEEAAKAFAHSQSYRVTAEENEHGIVARVQLPTKVPEELSLIVGDFLNAARSALDYIAAVVANKYGIPVDKSWVQFPIYTDPGKFTGSPFVRVLTGQQAAELAVFRAAQPYNTSPSFLDNTLYALREMSNSDKHRLITFTEPAWFEFGPNDERRMLRPGPDGHTEFTLIAGRNGSKVKVSLGFNVAFPKGSPGINRDKSAGDLLQQISTHVEEIIREFEKLAVES